MWHKRRKNPDDQAIDAQATRLTESNLKAYCTLAYNEMLESFEAKIEAMEDGPKKDRAVERYESLDFDSFFGQNKQDFFQTLKEAFYKKLWSKAEAEEAARPSPSPLLSSAPVVEEPSSALHDEPTSAVLPSSPSLEEPRSEAPFEASDCESQLFSPESVKALLASVDPKYKRETCHVLNRIESLMIERMGAELSGVLG